MVSKGGMTPRDALIAATKGGPDLMDLSSETGTLDPGKSADLIAVDGDPLVDPTAVQRVGYVMVPGPADSDERTMMRSSLLPIALALSAPAFAQSTPAGDVPPKDVKDDAQGRQGCRKGERRRGRAAGAAFDSPPRAHARLHRDARPPDDPQRERRADRQHVLRRLHRSLARTGAAGDVPVQRRSGLVDDVAAHGFVRADEGRCVDPRDDRRPSVPLCRQPGHVARRQRPRLHRCSYHRAVAAARQGREQGCDGRRPRHRRVHPDGAALPHQIPALEQPEVHHRRKLRHHPRRGAGRIRC